MFMVGYGNEHVIPEFLNRFRKLKGKDFKFKEMGLKQDHSFISMILFSFHCILKEENIYRSTIMAPLKKLHKNLVKLSKIFKKIFYKKKKLYSGSTKKIA